MPLTQRWAVLAAVAANHLAARGSYSYDPTCVPNRCVNPVFPGIRTLGQDFLAAQEERDWACVKDGRADLYLSFCKGMVRYDFAVPVADGTEKEVGPLVRAEEDKALKAYFQHLSGLKVDAFDFRDPHSDPCAESIWRMVCYAHFPKCNELQESKYLRPCASSCTDYIAKCGVTCCDESVTCSWEKEITRADGSSAVETGFVAHSPPSSFCTGVPSSAGRPSVLLAAVLAAMMSSRPALAGALALLAGSLQGCEPAVEVDPRQVDAALGIHVVGAWRRQPDFSLSDAYAKEDGSLVYDSCSDGMIDTLHVCSGRGHCEAWDINDVSTPLGFCHCDAGWAGPECRDRRKSQAVAFAYSVFFGFLGADLFYLGYPYEAFAKLCSVGGLGVWYLYDIFRIGVGPPYTAAAYRTAQDLPFWAFNVASVSLMTMLGFFIFFAFILYPHIKAKRKPRPLSSFEEKEEHKSRPNVHLDKVKHLLS